MEGLSTNILHNAPLLGLLVYEYFPRLLDLKFDKEVD